MIKVEQLLGQVKEIGLTDRLAAEVWLAELLEKDRAFLFAYPGHRVSPAITEKFLTGVQEMAAGKPLAQLTGHKEFYGLDFRVNGDVLIPRPESELLVELVKEYLDGHGYGGRLVVADVGTGSGCILLAILKTLGFGRGIGLEISGKALEVARKNAENLGLADKVTWLESDLLSGLTEPVQVMVANLPYIGKDRFHFIAENVAKHEPEVALYGGSDGLELYRKMFAQLKKKHWKPDFLAGEFGFGQQEEMEKILKKYFRGHDYRVIPDLAGIPRVFVVEFYSQNNV